MWVGTSTRASKNYDLLSPSKRHQCHRRRSRSSKLQRDVPNTPEMLRMLQGTVWRCFGKYCLWTWGGRQYLRLRQGPLRLDKCIGSFLKSWAAWWFTKYSHFPYSAAPAPETASARIKRPGTQLRIWVGTGNIGGWCFGFVGLLAGSRAIGLRGSRRLRTHLWSLPSQPSSLYSSSSIPRHSEFI